MNHTEYVGANWPTDELTQITPRNEELLRIADRCPAPQDWYDEASEHQEPANNLPCEYLCLICTIQEGGRYSAVVLNLPGVESRGDTEEEAVRNVREVILRAIQPYTAHGEPIPWTDGHAGDVPEDAKRFWITVRSSDTADPEPEAKAEEPLDFELLRQDARLYCESLDGGWSWKADDAASLPRVLRALPRLIDMAERCEASERDRNFFSGISHQWIKANARVVQHRKEIEAERDQLKAQLAEAQAKLANVQRVGLNQAEEIVVGRVVDLASTFGGGNLAATFKAIIDRLSRQKALPWIKVVDGKRPEGFPDDAYVIGAVQSAGDTTPRFACTNMGNWWWPRVRHVLRVSDLLATLPKE